MYAKADSSPDAAENKTLNFCPSSNSVEENSYLEIRLNLFVLSKAEQFRNHFRLCDPSEVQTSVGEAANR